ncbi:hypothetical protein [Rhizobium sp.]|uniref:hypothetical protein n=1 Tax=Rhizobium sp. TaxID=391 RepID=UPI0028AF0FB6
MGNEISDVDDIDLSSVVLVNDVTSPIPSHTLADREDRRAAAHTLAIDRFREVMKARGGRFAEMTAEEEGEIVDYLAIFAPRLWQLSEGMTE